MSGKFVVATLFTIAAFYAPVALSAPPDDYINEGKTYMLQGTLSGLRQAYAIFDKGMNDPEANTDRRLIFLHAVTRTAMLFIDTNDLAVQDSFLELAQAFGVTVTGDLIDELVFDLTLDPDGYYRVPGGAPSPDEIADIINNSIIPEIEAIIDELESITDTSGDRFRMFFTPDETGLENDLEVDYGEVLILKGLLYAFRGLLQAQTPYDIFISVDESGLNELLQEQGIDLNEGVDPLVLLKLIYINVDDPNKVSINKHFLQKYPNLLKLLPTSGHPQDGADILAQAKQDLIDGINYYFDAVDYIKSEEDDQEDDLLYLDSSTDFFINDIKEKLTTLRDSLINGNAINCPLETQKTYKVYNSEAEPIGVLILVYNPTHSIPGFHGGEGQLTFLDPDIPSPWEAYGFALDGTTLEIELDYVTMGEWRNGYFKATIGADLNSFTGGTFEWWGSDSGSISDLSGDIYSSEVITNVNVNLNPIFGSSTPVSPRDLLPQFGNDNVPIAGTFGHRLGDDATLGGILPDMTQSDWVALLGLQAPDLVTESFTTTLPSPATMGDKGKVRVNIENQGQTTATGKIKIDVYASADQMLDDDDSLLGSLSNQSISLTPGSFKAFDVSVEIPNDIEPGKYYMLVYIDSLNAIAETNEDNNITASAGQGQVELPDLVGTITHTFKEPAVAGDKAKVKVIVTNQSSVLAKGTINIPVYLSDDDLLDAGDTLLNTLLNRSINLTAGKSATFEVTVTLPNGLTEDDYYFLANVDSTNAVPESDEDNNLAVTATALSVERPDLIGAVTHTFKEPAAAADKAKVRVAVINQGAVLAKGKINIAVFLSEDEILDEDDTWLTTVVDRSINLKPGKFVTLQISVTLPADLTPGDYYFLAYVDSGDAISESNEDNNLAATADTDTLTVERPDLVGTITHTFKNPAATGAKAKVTVIVRNQGNVLAKGKIQIDIYASTDQNLGGDTLLASKLNIPINLKKDKTKTVNISVALTGLAPGDYYFLADIDSANVIAESDEDNNVAATDTELTVQ